jgi:hypothetical protein
MADALDRLAPRAAEAAPGAASPSIEASRLAEER